MFVTNVRNERSINMTGGILMRSRRAAVKAQRRTFMLGLMVLTVIVIGSVLLGTIRTQAAPAERPPRQAPTRQAVWSLKR